MQLTTNRIKSNRGLAIFVLSMMLMASLLGGPALADHYTGGITLTSTNYNSTSNTTTYTWTMTGEGGSASHLVINTCLGNTATASGGSRGSATYTNSDPTTGVSGYKWEGGGDLLTGDTFTLTFSGNTGISGTANWTIKKGSVPAHFNSGTTGGPSCSAPTQASASVAPGTCVFANGASTTPVTASISPLGGATIALFKTGTVPPVHTFTTNGEIYNADPGIYTWQATATSGHVLSGTSSGGFTAASCPPQLTQATASVAPATCVFANDTSTTPVTASISPVGGATIALFKTGTVPPVHTFTTNGEIYNAPPGTYTWQAAATTSHVLSGTSSGGFTAVSCALAQPSPATVLVSPGACVFANDVSRTPVTASISPAGGATIVLSKTGTGPVHTFTSGAPFNAAPGDYTWVAVATGGYVMSGASSGGFTAVSCAPAPQAVQVLGEKIVKPKPVQVLGEKVVKGQALPNTGPTIPVGQSLALALSSILVGVFMTYAGRRRLQPAAPGYAARHQATEWKWSFDSSVPTKGRHSR